jgi:ribulose-bisphosphate carboxylase large chain
MTGDRIEATYHVETPHPLLEAAEAMAGEQSSGTFVDVPGETEKLRERHAGRVEEVVELGTNHEPSLPGTSPPEDADRPLEYVEAEVTVSFPVRNTGSDLPNLRTMVAGNLFELRQFSGLRLKDIDLPADFAAEFPGPQFGIEGTRPTLASRSASRP